MPDLTKLMDEFDDWHVDVPFEEGDVRVLCCPEDRRCLQSACDKRSRVCPQCEVPLCDQRSTHVGKESPKLPPACLANDMMIFYAPKESYMDKMTVVEMICCSVCITSMICFSLEVKYGNMFDTNLHMHRHRVGGAWQRNVIPVTMARTIARTGPC